MKIPVTVQIIAGALVLGVTHLPAEEQVNRDREARLAWWVRWA